MHQPLMICLAYDTGWFLNLRHTSDEKKLRPKTAMTIPSRVYLLTHKTNKESLKNETKEHPTNQHWCVK